MDSHFWDIIRDIRSLIHKPDDAQFILHTPIGTITVDRFVYRSEAGFVFLQGTDENGRERVAGFSEQQLLHVSFRDSDEARRQGRADQIQSVCS